MPPTPRDAAHLVVEIKSKAMEAGFDAVGITRIDDTGNHSDALQAWLGQGRHGTMDWMETNADRRADPHTLWPQARSAIVLGMNYGPDHNPLAILEQPGRAAISVYAQNRDYHDLVKKRLKRLARWLVEREPCEVKVFVDTAPVMEKPLGEKSGIGWQGKHTNLVSRAHGSWLFLGSIFTTLALPADGPHAKNCGGCTACLEICPTEAFPAPYQLDARRCISYLTIEHKGHIGEPFRKPMANRIYGCDDCLAICPWNKFAARAKEAAFHPRDELRAPKLAELATLDDTAFRALFKASPVKRIGRDRFVRNVLIALGNSGDQQALPLLVDLMSDASSLVRAMAVWAYGELATKTAGQEDTDRLQALCQREQDEDVRHEWRSLLKKKERQE